ncbi:hypothetical protein FRC17_009517 [Serendipita sp. 399]|nr:hypothetical protein FRC17_009517 [Serendipita sp. 399]
MLEVAYDIYYSENSISGKYFSNPSKAAAEVRAPKVATNPEQQNNGLEKEKNWWTKPSNEFAEILKIPDIRWDNEVFVIDWDWVKHDRCLDNPEFRLDRAGRSRTPPRKFVLGI